MTDAIETLQICIRCIECRRPVKLNGETRLKHTELLHRHIPGEKAALCQYCRMTAANLHKYAGQGCSWIAGKTVQPSI